MAFYRFDTFKEGLLHVISLGYDTDTVGAVYGQLASAYYGYNLLPKKWRDQLMQHNMIYQLAQELDSLCHER
jgi:ADP-ribosyl-[dinitrogen reductase] hydrolase